MTIWNNLIADLQKHPTFDKISVYLGMIHLNTWTTNNHIVLIWDADQDVAVVF